MLDVGPTIAAVGGLGTAAFALVDATKPVSRINYAGFSGMRHADAGLTIGNDASNSTYPRKNLKNTRRRTR